MAAQNRTLVEMALKHQGCTQRALASKLGVSTTQVSKWKNDPAEYMSSDMTDKLRVLAGLTKDDLDADVIAWAGSAENAAGWDAWFAQLFEDADQNAETGYGVEFEDEVLTETTVRILNAMGMAPPHAACEDHKLYNEYMAAVDDDGSDNGPTYTAITETVRKIYNAYADVYGFHVAYVSPVIDDDDFDDAADDVYLEYTGCLLQLAACKVDDIAPAIAPNFAAFKAEWIEHYEKWVTAIKRKAMKVGIPLPWELMDLVYDDHESLGHSAEQESLGFNRRSLHPDVYMNEILVSLRAIHQVLPAILQKLGMENEFEMDEADLHLKTDGWRGPRPRRPDR